MPIDSIQGVLAARLDVRIISKMSSRGAWQHSELAGVAARRILRSPQAPSRDGTDLEQNVFYQVFAQRIVYFPDDLFLEKIKVVQPG